MMDEIPERDICTIKIGNHEFRTYNLTLNDGSRKKLVFILSPLGFSSKYTPNSSSNTRSTLALTWDSMVLHV